jgi:hypothetical protein
LILIDRDLAAAARAAGTNKASEFMPRRLSGPPLRRDRLLELEHVVAIELVLDVTER